MEQKQIDFSTLTVSQAIALVAEVESGKTQLNEYPQLREWLISELQKDPLHWSVFTAEEECPYASDSADYWSWACGVWESATGKSMWQSSPAYTLGYERGRYYRGVVIELADIKAIKVWFEESKDNIREELQLLERHCEPTRDSYGFRILYCLRQLAEKGKGLKFQTRSGGRWDGEIGSYCPCHYGQDVFTGIFGQLGQMQVDWEAVDRFWLET